MDSPSVPQTPDPIATANAQGAANLDAARLTTKLNRADQYTPFGSMTWTQGPATRTFNQDRYDAALKAAQASQGQPGGDQPINPIWDIAKGVKRSPTTPGAIALPDRNDAQFYDETPGDQWSSHINLDPRIQSILDSQLQTQQGMSGVVNDALGRVNSEFSKPIDYSNLPAAGDASLTSLKNVEDALYGRATSRLDPQFSQQEQQLRSDLMNRGIVEGSEAWKNQLDNFNRSKSDAYDLARTTAITGAGQEASRLFGMQNTAHQDALSELERKRALVLNELNGLKSGQQVQTPSFSSTPGGTVNPAPVAQSIWNGYQGQMNNYNAGVGASNSMMGGLFQLGSAALPFML